MAYWDIPTLVQYDGTAFGKHHVSVCIDSPSHDCFATIHGSTKAKAVERAERVVMALSMPRRSAKHVMMDWLVRGIEWMLRSKPLHHDE
jgi:hypothetical protein